MDVDAAFVADGQPAESVQPRQRTLYDPAVPAQSLARLNAPAGDAALDAPLAQVNAAKTGTLQTSPLGRPHASSPLGPVTVGNPPNGLASGSGDVIARV
jgi:hypothetical protein